MSMQWNESLRFSKLLWSMSPRVRSIDQNCCLEVCIWMGAWVKIISTKVCLKSNITKLSSNPSHYYPRHLHIQNYAVILNWPWWQRREALTDSRHVGTVCSSHQQLQEQRAGGMLLAASWERMSEGVLAMCTRLSRSTPSYARMVN